MPQTDTSSPVPHPLKFLKSRALQIAILVAAILAAWSNSYDSPLVLDDLGSIRDNETIRPPYSFDSLLNPPSAGGQTVAGRPLLNLSFAANHLLFGDNYLGYRVTNTLIHVSNALLVYGIAYLLMQITNERRRLIGNSFIPFFISLVWAVHPFTTAAVSYLAQRAESLTALFILLTLYSFVRSIRSKMPTAWLAISIATALLGTACKETMAATPFVVALLAWTIARPESKQHLSKPTLSIYFTLLFLTLIPTILFSLGTGDRSGTASLSVGAESIDYLKTQSWAILHYLQLSLWPSGLVFDYGRDIATPDTAVWITCGSTVLILLATSLYLSFKKSMVGFLGLSVFLLLAPSSSIFPLTDPVFEHRFYLPLVFVSAISILILSRLPNRYSTPLLSLFAFCLAFATHARNKVYQNDIELWSSALQFSDNNARAHTNLGTLLLADGNVSSAIQHLKKAVAINPTPLRRHNLANALALGGNPQEAIPLYQEALASEPHFQAALLGLAQAFSASKNYPQASQQFTAVLEIDSTQIEALRGFARAEAAQNRNDSAIEAFQKICELTPQEAAAFFDLGDALAQAQRFGESKAAFSKTIELDPQNAQAFANLGNLHLMEKAFPKAIESYQKALELEANAMVHTNLAIALIYSKRIQEAKTQLSEALRIDPSYRPAQNIAAKLR